jgi:hypothetical protein
MNQLSEAYAVMKQLSETMQRYDVWMTAWMDEIEVGVAEKTLWSSKHDKQPLSVEGCLSTWNHLTKQGLLPVGRDVGADV